MSLTAYDTSTLEVNLDDLLADGDTVAVAAAGNDDDSNCNYPAAY